MKFYWSTATSNCLHTVYGCCSGRAEQLQQKLQRLLSNNIINWSFGKDACSLCFKVSLRSEANRSSGGISALQGRGLKTFLMRFRVQCSEHAATAFTAKIPFWVAGLLLLMDAPKTIKLKQFSGRNRKHDLGTKLLTHLAKIRDKTF